MPQRFTLFRANLRGKAVPMVVEAGSYRGATGKGTFTAQCVLIGARSKSGKCLGENAPPAANYVIVTLVGTSSLGA